MTLPLLNGEKAFYVRAALGALVGISAIGWLSTHLPAHSVLLIGSFGASAVIVFAAPHALMAHPRALIGGNLIGALVGVMVATYVPLPPWMLAGIAVSGAVFVMLLTNTLHAPGGAAALIAVHGAQEMAEGWYFVIEILLGALILGAIAMIVHNLPGPGRVGYPGPRLEPPPDQTR